MQYGLNGEIFQPVSLSPSTNAVNYGWQGLSLDTVSGNWDNEARQYAENTGTFTSQDPLGLAGGDLNLYRSRGNNPLGYLDPDGRFGLPGIVFGAVAGGLGGFLSSGGSIKATIIGAGAGAVVGAFNPWLAEAAGAGVAGIITGAASSAAGQLAGNLADHRALGTGFSFGSVVGSSVAGLTVGGALAAGGYAAAEAWTAARFATSITEGVLGGAGELAGEKVGKLVQTCP